MKFLIDEQLPQGICVGLASKGHDGIHVVDVLGYETDDAAIVSLAISENRILITKDSDFAAMPMVTGLRIVWLRIGNVSNRGLIEWLESRWDDVEYGLGAGDMLIEVD